MFSVLCLLTLATFVDAQTGTNYCTGQIVTLTADSGAFADHQGPGNYQKNLDCQWDVSPVNTISSDRIIVRVGKLDLEYGNDWLAIYDGPVTSTSSPLVAWTGNVIPPPFETPSNRFLAYFFTDNLGAGKGFNISYHVVRCPSGCSGHGLCEENNQCTCDAGWTGPDCAQATCPAGGCLNNGTCVGVACQCREGFYGGDCGSPYCESTEHSMTADSGEITSNHGSGDYLNNMACQWKISPSTPADAIQIEFDEFDLETDADFLTIWDSPFKGVGSIIAKLSGGNLPPRISAFSGEAFLEFSSDVSLVARGFSARYTAVRCAGSCNGNGWCEDDNQCLCKAGFTGLACQTPTCADDCHGRGVCSSNSSGYFCTCQSDWSGVACETCAGPNCQASNFCGSSGTPVVVTDFSGSISDHTGIGFYEPNSNCHWHLEPAGDVTNLLITFVNLSLVPGSAHVRVYDGILDSAHLLAEWTGGAVAGSKPPSVVTSGRSARVEFVSNSATSTASGFTATFTSLSCPEDCNRRGHCDSTGSCHCAAGYAGSSCNRTVCVGDCGRGTCQNNMCVCEPGWFGPGCDDSQCSGTVVITDASGRIRDHSGGSAYRLGTECEFMIRPSGWSAGQEISLFFDKIDLGPGAQFRILNATGGDPQFVSSVGGKHAPMRFSGPFGLRFVTSSTLAAATGIDVRFSLNGECTDSCNGQGSCAEQSCYCDAGYQGATCANPRVPTVVSNSETRTIVVPPYSWEYVEYNVTRQGRNLELRHNRPGEEGWPAFFLRYGLLPTGTSRGTQSDAWWPFYIQLPVEVLQPSIEGLYYGGIYNYDVEAATVQTTFVLGCPDRCGTGYCDKAQGICRCGQCWTGPLCDVPDTSGSCGPTTGTTGGSPASSPPLVEPSSDGSSASGNQAGLIVAMVILVVAFLGAVAFVIYRVRGQIRKSISGFAQQRRDELREEMDEPDSSFSVDDS